MTREEKIEKILDDEFDTDLYDYITDNSYCNYCAGFRRGVKWSDEHHINVWHDAIEEPQENMDILFISKNKNVHKASKIDNQLYDCLKNTNGIKKWAYINDLLPK